MNKNRLTKYKSGGIKELFTISWPIMLSAASAYLMIVIDRVILSRYSQESFNACFAAIQWYWAFLYAPLELVLIIEVFVGQYNGAERLKEIGNIVWQMLWFCLILFSIFIPVSLYITPFLLPNNVALLGVPYLTIVLFFVPIDCIGYGVLTGFFVGIGETKIIPIVSICANLLNLILDILFVFGCGIIPEMGVIGAAIATVISQSASALILFLLFIRKKYRQKYGTGRTYLSLDLMKNCLTVGFPNALNRLVSSFFWALMMQFIVSHVSADEFSGFGISHSIYMLFFFVIEGISSGVRTVCSNAIGARKHRIVWLNLRSWLKLGSLAIALITVGMVIYPDLLIKLFLKNIGSGDIYFIAKHMMLWAWLVFIADMLSSNLFSILIAAADTKFTMVVNTTSFIVLSIVPTYFLIQYFGAMSTVFWQCMFVDYCFRGILFFHRYRGESWKLKSIVRS